MFKKKMSLGCCVILLFLLLYWNHHSNTMSSVEAKESKKAATHDIYDEDDRLELTAHETYEYNGEENPVGSYLYNQHMWILKSYDEEEIAKSCHAQFDEKNRLLYALGYDRFSILYKKTSYCEERIYEWDDVKHTCRKLDYKSNSMLYEDGFCVAYRYLFDVNEYQFSEDDRLLSHLTYSREVGSDAYGYSNELFFDRGYQAEYDGERIMSELECHDYWGTNETGSWEYRVYQYDKQGNCILKVIVNEDEILLYCYEYDTALKQIDVYTYLVNEDWELTCDDGSVYYFRPKWGKPAVKKVTADKMVEKQFFYGKTMDMGQQHYYMPKEVEDTVEDHYYVVQSGDCLSKIAYKFYKNGAYYDLLYRVNRSVIGWDKNLILPGTRLFIPETGNAQDTK